MNCRCTLAHKFQSGIRHTNSGKAVDRIKGPSRAIPRWRCRIPYLGIRGTPNSYTTTLKDHIKLPVLSLRSKLPFLHVAKHNQLMQSRMTICSKSWWQRCFLQNQNQHKNPIQNPTTQNLIVRTPKSLSPDYTQQYHNTRSRKDRDGTTTPKITPPPPHLQRLTQPIENLTQQTPSDFLTQPSAPAQSPEIDPDALIT